MSKTYSLKEIYYTIQGEGIQAGRPAVFMRFSGCNLWSGREEDRGQAICQFCDTDFRGTDGVNGGKYSSGALASFARTVWQSGAVMTKPYIVCTGGEPLLQMDNELIDELHAVGFEVAIETNGTVLVPDGIDWICMSPKANTDIIVRSGDEIKIIYPQTGIDPEDFMAWDFNHFLIQPMDGPVIAENTVAAIEYCATYPQWQLSLQTHKLLAIP